MCKRKTDNIPLSFKIIYNVISKRYISLSGSTQHIINLYLNFRWMNGGLFSSNTTRYILHSVVYQLEQTNYIKMQQEIFGVFGMPQYIHTHILQGFLYNFLYTVSVYQQNMKLVYTISRIRITYNFNNDVHLAYIRMMTTLKTAVTHA